MRLYEPNGREIEEITDGENDKPHLSEILRVLGSPMGSWGIHEVDVFEMETCLASQSADPR